MPILLLQMPILVLKMPILLLHSDADSGASDVVVSKGFALFF